MSYATNRSIFGIAVFAAAALGLYGQDGVITIDQKIALSGKSVPGDAPGFPITISQPGSYRLTSNIVVPDAATNAIEVSADYVTIDLNGFSIIGPNVCTPNPTTCRYSGSGIGIHAGSFSEGVVAPRGVRVFNGTVRGMGAHGIRMLGESTSVERVVSESNGGPGIVTGGSVADSVSRVNGGHGILGLMVRNSIVMDNRGYGLYVGNHSGSVTGNIITGNGAAGLRVPAGSVVSGNAVNNNGGYGISVECPSALIGNTIAGNVSGAIQAAGVCTLANNAQ